MADSVCRGCGTTVPAGAATCPHCGIDDPVTVSATPGPRPGRAAPAVGRSPETEGPAPERDTAAGSRLKSAAKAAGCLLLALIVLGIAIVVGVFDLFF